MEPSNSNSNKDNIPGPSSTPPTFDRATFIKSKLKSGAKRILGQKHDDSDSSSSDVHQVEDVFEDAAFDPQQILDEDTQERDSLRDKLHRGAHDVAAAVKNPRRALRSRYTRNIAENVGGQPYSHDKEFDRELVEAHDALEHARSRADGVAGSKFDRHGDRTVADSDIWAVEEGEEDDQFFFHADIGERSSGQQDIEEAKARLEQVQAKRESMRTAWILGRHVKRVRVATPMTHPPTKSAFMEERPGGLGRRLRWDKYLGHLVLWQTRAFTPYYIDDFDELPFDPRDLTLTFERLAIVSTPWQNFLFDVREVYLWNNPRRTLKYLVTYCILWYFQHIVTAAFALIIFLTARNKVQPTRLETVRSRVERAKNEDARAQAWAELIQRHGKQDWVEPLLDNLGPLIQLELGDMSNMLEVFQSFYRWERPRRTWITLAFFATCFLGSLLTSMEFCVRIFWLGVGFAFFVTLPVSAKSPKYRKLVNPFYWIFWKIPNLAEQAIAQLQEKAIIRDESRLEVMKNKAALEGLALSETPSSDDDRNSDPENKPITTKDMLQSIQNDDQAIFRAVDTETHTNGRLVLRRDGMWYCDKMLKSHHPYSSLTEIRKVDLNTSDTSDASKRIRIARRIQKSSSLKLLPSGVEFLFRTSQPDVGDIDKKFNDNRNSDRLALTVSESDRDRIFSLVVSWSGLKWQPLFSLNTKNKVSPGSGGPSKHGKGNKDFDTLIKGFVE